MQVAAWLIGYQALSEQPIFQQGYLLLCLSFKALLLDWASFSLMADLA